MRSGLAWSKLSLHYFLICLDQRGGRRHLFQSEQRRSERRHAYVWREPEIYALNYEGGYWTYKPENRTTNHFHSDENAN